MCYNVYGDIMKKMMTAWLTITSMLILSLLFIGLNVEKHNKEYKTLENDLVEAADVYIKTKDVDIKANESKKISMDKLIEENIIKSDQKDKLKCDGYVIVKKKINKLDFSPYIKCDEYETME